MDGNPSYHREDMLAEVGLEQDPAKRAARKKDVDRLQVAIDHLMRRARDLATDIGTFFGVDVEREWLEQGAEQE